MFLHSLLTVLRNDSIKISGQIGDSRQKDRLSFTSLTQQIDAVEDEEP